MIDNDGDSLCSFTAIEEGMGYTAAHCVEPAVRFGPVTINGEVATLSASNPAIDFAVVRSAGIHCPCATPGPAPALDEPVLGVGFPSVLGATGAQVLSWGAYQGTQAFLPLGPLPVHVVTTRFSHGMSGGGVFYVRPDGTVIYFGVIVAGIAEENVYFVTPLPVK
jgi:hypothetical protein